jgi:lysyl-tRNA synthetase class 2
MSEQLSELEIQRRQSLEELINLGINPYPAELFPVNVSAREVNEKFVNDSGEYQEIHLAGRIMTRRIMGNASFAVLQDSSDRIQVYIRRDDICPDEDKTLYNTVFKKLLDIGDIIGISGYAFTTQTGETTIHVNSLKVLTKSLRPLPIVKEKDGELYIDYPPEMAQQIEDLEYGNKTAAPNAVLRTFLSQHQTKTDDFNNSVYVEALESMGALS